jgi:hypothetical protein
VTFGAVGNVNDLLNLKGVDVAITQADVLDHFRRELKVPNIETRIQYISPLYLAEVHVYARAEIRSLQDLAGRKVAFNTPGSAANLTGQVVFQRLGIRVDPVLINNAIALEKMRSGEIAAVVHVVGKPNDLFAKFKPEPGFHFVPVEYNWPKESERYARVARFIEAYFSKFTQLQQPPFQPKWQDINLAGRVPGWTRYRVAEEALAKLSRPEQAKASDPLRAKFEAFVTSGVGADKVRSLTTQEREELFNKFREWQRSR